MVPHPPTPEILAHICPELDQSDALLGVWIWIRGDPGTRDVGEFTYGVFSVACDAGYKAPGSPLPQSWLLNSFNALGPPTPIKSSLEIRPEKVDFCACNQENPNLQPVTRSSGEEDSNPVLTGSEVILPSSGQACNTFTRYKNGHRLPGDYRANGGEGMGVLIAGPRAPCGNCVTCEFQPLEVSVIWESKHWVDQLAEQHLFPDGRCGVSMDFTQFPGGTGNETIWSQHGNSS